MSRQQTRRRGGTGQARMSRYYVCGSNQLKDGDRCLLSVPNGRELVVLRSQGRLYSFSNVCLHMGGPVGEGTLIGKVEAVLDEEGKLLGERFSEHEIHLVCPWHGWEYDIENGECAGNRNLRLPQHEVVEEAGAIYVVA